MASTSSSTTTTTTSTLSVEALNEIVAKVALQKEAWANLAASAKLALLVQIRDRLDQEWPAWVEASARGHGYDQSNPAHGHLVSEVHLKGPAMFGLWLNSMILNYEALASEGRPIHDFAVRTTPAGYAAVGVFPYTIKEKVYGAGVRAELYIESGNVEQYTPADCHAGLAAILAAGNFEAPTDILHEMFNLNQVVVCKTNPVNCHCAPVIARILQPLTAPNYLAIVDGGIDVGKALIAHPAVDRLLLTGSARAYDMIMWGTPAEQAANKAANRRQFQKEFDAELGSVNPYIITPGSWSASELEAHAQQLVSFKMFNNGHICASPQIVVTCKQWPQRQAFLSRVRELLSSYPSTRAYYPGCDKSYQQHLEQTTGDNVCNNPALFSDKSQHPLFITDISPDHFALQNEAFCPVLTEVTIDTAPSASDFLPAAVSFANTRCWGSLTATVIVDPRTQQASKAALDKAVDDLKFGAVSVNYGALNSAAFGQLPWGAYPRHAPEDVQSGIGKIGNCYLYKNVTKSVVWGPFTSPAQPKVPFDGPARLRRDSAFTRYASVPTAWRLMRLLAVVLTGH